MDEIHTALIRGVDETRWDLRAVVEEICLNVSRDSKLQGVHICSVFREANEAADWLARNVFLFQVGDVWSMPPRELQNILFKDSAIAE